MHIKESDSHEMENSKQYTVTVKEYRFPSELFSLGTALIDGRYPDENRVTNASCEEAYFVISGTGTIHSEFGDFHLKPEDVYHFKMDEKFWVEGNELRVVLVNAPKWTPEQHKNVE